MRHYPLHSAPSDSLPPSGVNFFFQKSFAAPRMLPAARCRWMRVGASSSFAPTITAEEPCYKGSARIGRHVNQHSRRERTVTETVS